MASGKLFRRMPSAFAIAGLLFAEALPRLVAASSEFETLLPKIRWVCYAPTNYNPDLTPQVLPSDDSIRADMRALRSAGFDGLVTYGAHLPAIVRLAQEADF